MLTNRNGNVNVNVFNILYLTVRINTEMYSHADTCAEFLKNNNLIVLPEVFLALWHSNIENLLINEKQLFITTFSNTVTLEEFENKQLENIIQVRILFMSIAIQCKRMYCII